MKRRPRRKTGRGDHFDKLDGSVSSIRSHRKT
jgi:hypothetical protein